MNSWESIQWCLREIEMIQNPETAERILQDLSSGGREVPEAIKMALLDKACGKASEPSEGIVSQEIRR